MAAVF